MLDSPTLGTPCFRSYSSVRAPKRDVRWQVEQRYTDPGSPTGYRWQFVSGDYKLRSDASDWAAEHCASGVVMRVVRAP